MKSFKSIYSLASLSAREWIRLKFFHIVIFFGLLFVAFTNLISTLTFSVQERILYDFGLGSLELALVLIACLMGSHTIHREIERKTMLVLLSRPISRSFVIIGALGSICILCFIFALGFVLSLILTAPEGISVPSMGVFISAFATLQKAAVIASVAIAFGVMVRPMMALVAAISYWILCYSIVDVEFFVSKMKSDFLSDLISNVKMALPQFHSYNWKTYYAIKNIPTTSEIMWTTSHNIAWMCIWVLIACVAFRRKEIV